MLWLALHFPQLPLELLAAGNADPQQALVIVEDNRIYMRNIAARARGIECGSTLATAHSICTDLKFAQRDTHAERRRLRTLADTLYRFSAAVSIQAPDTVLLEIDGSLKLFHGAQALSDAAVEVCQCLGHNAVARTGRTTWAAIALARSGEKHLADVPLSAAGLELADIHPNVVERFANMGIYTLGPLLDLPNKALGKRLGRPLLEYLMMLTGERADPREATTPAPAFERSLHLLQPISDKQDLHAHAMSPMAKLTGELQQWLITHQLGCERLLWRMGSHNQTHAEVPVRFARGKQQAADILRVSQLKLESAALPEEVLTVTLHAQRLTPWTAVSQALFQHHAAVTQETPAAEIIDELNARLGEGTCYGIQSRTQHTPESAWFAVQAHRLANLPSSHPEQHLSSVREVGEPFDEPAASLLTQHSKRPLWLFDPPRQIQRNELELIQGPERIQSQWWQTPATCRDYYIALHRSGAECWAYVDEQTNWYLHGYFG